MIRKTTRSILSVLLAVLLLVTSIPLTPAFADGGTVSPQSESGEGRALEPAADGVYQISTAAELREFAQRVNNGELADATAVLTANIVLNEKIEVDENGTVTNQEKLSEWTPIGSDSRSYTGTFDGNGHTISGLYIDSSSDNYQGLFGYVDTGGTVKDLSVSGTVSGGMFVGGIVGYNNGGTVTGCTFSGSGSVSGNSYVGGVVGVVGDSSGTVKNCYNTGDVTGGGYVGGVVGQNSGTVENCYNTGTVSGNSNYVGGVVGNSSGTVKNCYNTGSVSGIRNVGGVVGYNSGTVENCYNTGTVTGTYDYVGGVVGQNRASVTNCYNTGTVTVTGTYDFVGGVVGHSSGGSSASASVTNCYNTGRVSGNSYVGGVVGDNRSTVENCYNTGTVTGTDDYVGGVVGYSSDGISASASVTNCYNTGRVSGNSYVGGVVGDNRGTVTGCYFLQTADVNENLPGIGGGSAEGAAAVNDLDTLCEKFTSDPWTISPFYNHPVLKTNPEGGLGTATHPYEIKTATQLKTFRDIVNGANNQTADTDAHAKLMNNIDLNPDMEISEDGTVTGARDQWTPIGTSEENAYTGNFNGNGHKIENLYINTTYSGADNQGLFGFVGTGGTVQNLTVSGNVSGDWHVGGVVGYNNGGTVTGCIFSGSGSVSVTGSYYVGGVVGENNGSVINCYNTSSVTGVTGVTGSSDYVGGVVGDNGGIVENCYNTGAVNSIGNYVGGVVGDNGGPVKNCYNTGTVTGSYYVGGVVGDNRGTVKNCYYQIDKGATVGSDGTTADDTTTVAKTAAEFQSGEVAYLLQKEQPAESGQVWGQTLGGEENSLPTLVALNPGAAQPVYKVTFKYGYDSAPADEISYTNGSVKFPAFERKGYTFAGWTPTDTTISQDTTFTAQWTANTYTVTLHTNDGTIAEGQNVTSYIYGVGAKLPTENEITKTGYIFAGWYNNADLTGDPVTEISKTDINDKAYWAKWEEVENPEPDPTPTPTPDPEPSGPSTGDSTGWDDIRDELENAEKGDQITIDMGDETKVPAEIFESLAGKDVDVTFDLGDIQWSVNGADIPTDTDFTDIDMGVTMNSDGIPVNVINTITGEVGTVQITLAHNGEFGFTMILTAPLGKENAGYWANLYHYDEDAEALNFETAAEIDADGDVTIPFSHASQYAIVIDTHSHATVDVSDLFIDIAPDAWYKDAIQYAYDNGLMTGVSDTEFAPEATTTRAMIVSILARLEGVTTAQAAGFADVDDNDWYATAVNWAANVGVVNGYEDNTFQPNTAITREQLAAILMNYAAYKGEDVSARADLTSYTDQPSTWAEEAMSWAVAEGLISGVTADTLQPQGAATRAQVAAILQRFLSE